jgi:ATP-dependent 26S proteasome regulatory subunit
MIPSCAPMAGATAWFAKFHLRSSGHRMTQAQFPFTPDHFASLPEDLPLDEERALVEAAVRKTPAAALPLAMMLLNQKHQYKALAQERGQELERLSAAPWIPATLLKRMSEDAALVAIGSRQVGVLIGPKVDRAALVTGAAVLLNKDQSVIVDLGPEISRAGLVGRFSRWHGTQAVIRGPSDDEHAMHVAPALRGSELSNGDLLLYDPDASIALERVETRHEHANLLEEVRSDLRIGALGALDELFESILEDVTIHLLNRELAERHQLDAVRSITLIGPPGVGKTSLMMCLANELAERAGVRVRVLLARPSIHRSKWYGESEERARAMFEEVKRAAREEGVYIFLFLDDADQIGSRDTTNDVDARVLPTFLHEIEALRATERVLVVAATNKPEQMDPALARAGRLGDREYRVPRPGTREASGQILRCYLNDRVPCRQDGAPAGATDVIEEALSAMYSPNGEFSTLARLFFRDGSSRSVTPAMVVSGSLLKNAVEAAKQRGCRRVLRGGPEGVTPEDLLAALAVEFANVVHRLKPGLALHAFLDLPPDFDVVRVEAHNRHLPRREFIRPPSAGAAA